MLVALDRGHKRQRDAGVAAGGLDQHCLAGRDLAGLLGRVDHGKADAVLHARCRVLAFQLGDDGSRQTGCHAVQPHQRSAANQFSYIRGNARHDDLLFRGYGPRLLMKRILGDWCSLSVEKSRAIRAHIGIGAGTRTVLATSMHRYKRRPNAPHMARANLSGCAWPGSENVCLRKRRRTTIMIVAQLSTAMMLLHLQIRTSGLASSCAISSSHSQ